MSAGADVILTGISIFWILGLHEIRISSVVGFWRILPVDYVWSLIVRVMTWVSDNQLEWDNIPKYEADIALLEAEPESVMRDFFWRRFAEPSGENLKIRVDEVKRHCAKWNLSKGQKVISSSSQ